MLDIRYHIVYLCVIFLMLGFGILIGVSLTGPVQVHQQASTLAALRVQVDGAVQEGRQAKDRLAKVESAIDSLRPALVQGQLAGKTVTVLQTDDATDAADAARTALLDAGATVAVVTINRKFVRITAKERQTLLTSETISALPTPAPVHLESDDSASENAPVIARLAALLVQGTKDRAANRHWLGMLEDGNFISVNGELTNPCTLFVLVGGAQDDSTISSATVATSDLDIPLMEQIRAVSANQATLVGCESSDAAVSYMPSYQNAGLATIDCIDQPLGELALPYALHGGDDYDDYGFKATAKRQIPRTLEAKTAL